MSRQYRLLLTLFILLANSSPAFASEPTFQEQLQLRAEELKLSSDLQWWDLLHYHTFTVPPVVKSLVDDKRFFVAKDGKRDPEAELRQSIAELFRPAELGDDHLMCRFPARSAWLIKKLEIDPSVLPNVKCESFETWFKALDPQGLTLIFPSAYPNNPSSAFGHTLIRIDQRNSTPLLSYTANFAADANDPNALVYAAKGIFGGYSGYFSNAPYFEKVQQYGDLESRDIWEYKLNLSEEEVIQGVKHIWELREVAFDYFYFDENCSYQLLRIIDVAKPGTNLARRLWLWVIPVDTVRAIVEKEGLVGDVEFRPSTVKILKNRLNSVTAREIELAKALSLGEISQNDKSITSLDKESQVKIIDLGYEYLQYLLISRKKETEEVRATMYHFLRARSLLDVEAVEQEIETPNIRPEQGHKTSRVRLAVGTFDQGESFGEIEFRPAYHDLLDPSGGYTTGAEIQFFNLAVRLEEGERIVLEKFQPLSIVSITPWDRLTKPISWFVDLKAEQKSFGENERDLVYQGLTGFGLAYSVSEVTTFGFLQGGLTGNDRFKDDYAAGAGTRAGLLLFPDRVISAKVEIGATHFFAGEEYNEYGINSETRVSISDDVSLRISLDRFQEVNTKGLETKLSLDYYF